MLKFDANLTMLFNEVTFPERFACAAKAGFKGVEFLFPYEWQKEALAEKLEKHGLEQVLFNLPAGNWAGGERGIACLPDRVGEFQDGVGKAIDYAKVLKCSRVNCITGITPKNSSADKVHQTLVNNLLFAATKLEKAGIRFLVEPINNVDFAGFHLARTKDALQLFKEVNHNNLWL
ncbi:MAG: TIM barrel protein, partial [Dehalococcoidales bacterium]|nr:TIM barrel protein [Dehalococcoidales bacterium]